MHSGPYVEHWCKGSTAAFQAASAGSISVCSSIIFRGQGDVPGLFLYAKGVVMMGGIDRKKRVLVREYLVDLNATQAAIRAMALKGMDVLYILTGISK